MVRLVEKSEQFVLLVFYHPMCFRDVEIVRVCGYTKYGNLKRVGFISRYRDVDCAKRRMLLMVLCA